MYVAASSVATYFVFGLLLMKPLAYAGLALGASCSFTVSALFAGLLLHRRCGLASPFSAGWIKPVGGGATVMVAVVWVLKVVLPYPEKMNILFRAGWICLPIALGAVVYAAVTWKAGCGEWDWLREVFTRKVLGEDNDENTKDR